MWSGWNGRGISEWAAAKIDRLMPHRAAFRLDARVEVRRYERVERACDVVPVRVNDVDLLIDRVADD